MELLILLGWFRQKCFDDSGLEWCNLTNTWREINFGFNNWIPNVNSNMQSVMEIWKFANSQDIPYLRWNGTVTLYKILKILMLKLDFMIFLIFNQRCISNYSDILIIGIINRNGWSQLEHKTAKIEMFAGSEDGLYR